MNVEKLGTRLRSFISGNICLKFSVQCTESNSAPRCSTPQWIPNRKGTLSRDFLLLVFFMNQFPPAQDYPIRTVSNFFQNSRRYSQVKVHHRYQRHRWQICHQCQWHRRQNWSQYQQHRKQICHRYQRHRRQILPPVSLVLLILVANLPLVSTTPAANFPSVSTTLGAICHRYQWHLLQIWHRCQWKGGK